MTEPTISTTAIVAHGGMAFFGALVHAAKAHREKQSRGILDFIILTLMSSFSGGMFALLSLHLFGESQLYITMAISGTGGFLGVEGMSFLAQYIERFVLKK